MRRFGASTRKKGTDDIANSMDDKRTRNFRKWIREKLELFLSSGESGIIVF